MQRKRKDKYRLLKTMITARFLPSLVGFIQSKSSAPFLCSLSLSFFSFSPSLSHSFFSLSFDHSPLSSCSSFRSFSTSLCACVLLCIYLSIFRPFESREVSRLSRKTVSEKSVYTFFFFFSYSSVIYLHAMIRISWKNCISFSRLKM